jgi:Coenzyme PQQ synthesis protein D (PqqD)
VSEARSQPAAFRPRYVARSGSIASRVLGQEVMIMSAKDSTLFSLNEVATVIWEAADGQMPLEQIVAEKVCAQFEVAPEIALRDAQRLVEQLADHGILTVSLAPIAPSDPEPGRASKGAS